MGYKIETKVKLDYIQDFEMMFERMKLERPREAAVYYVMLILDNPKEFADFLKIAEELANITRRPLETGRACLLKHGIIDKTIISDPDAYVGLGLYIAKKCGQYVLGKNPTQAENGDTLQNDEELHQELVMLCQKEGIGLDTFNEYCRDKS